MAHLRISVPIFTPSVAHHVRLLRFVANQDTEWSGPQRVREILPDEADRLLAGRFAIIQVWRAINQPIRSNPLAIADARSVAAGDLLAAERRYPHRVGETYQVRYNPGHRWFYFPEMRRDEALVFKVYESAKDGRARFTAHTSFVDPTTPPSTALPTGRCCAPPACRWTLRPRRPPPAWAIRRSAGPTSIRRHSVLGFTSLPPCAR
jgi:hypothetical protein